MNLSQWTQEYIIMRYLQQKAAESQIMEKLAWNEVINPLFMGFYGAMANTYYTLQDESYVGELTHNRPKQSVVRFAQAEHDEPLGGSFGLLNQDKHPEIYKARGRFTGKL